MSVQEPLSGKPKFLLIALLMSLLLVISACQSLQQQASIPEVAIKASDYTFDSPAEIAAGMTYITMENLGEEIHHVQLLRLNDGVTMDDLQSAMQAQDEEKLLSMVTLHGGVGVLPKGGSGRVLMDLEEGQYLLACFIPSEDGIPHLAKGMLTPMAVLPGEASQAAQEPSVDAEVALRDFNIVLPETIKSGSQIWKVSNEGPQPHEVMLLKLGDNMTVSDVQAWAETMQGPPPFEPVGGMQGLSAGYSGYLDIDLSPGNYIATCDIPDPASGSPHSALGMMTQFFVQ